MEYKDINKLFDEMISFKIIDLELRYDDVIDVYVLELTINVNHGSCYEIYKLKFFNVQNFSIIGLCCESEFNNISIIDHKNDQYMKNNRFEFIDYENERIKFMCSSYELCL